ncbi:response regulator transcription factor [Anaerolentibacter hominis]|uniref:response regulator transcription factor n=1 Tax=Anaerolentibacter hominis TaxID=3079009 RepID=UPI0031B84A4F
MEKIFVIEDDENIRDMIHLALTSYGFDVMDFEAAEPALKEMEKTIPDLAIFDIMLPGMDGLEAIRILREKPGTADIPIIVLTAKDKEYDKVIGLDNGADDYITKPFGVLEMTARVRSLLRRVQKYKKRPTLLNMNSLTVNTDTREVLVGDRPVGLTYKEYELLHYLMTNHARVVSREELLDRLWGFDCSVETRTLDIHIKTLRQKLGPEASEYIKTIRSVGYRFLYDKD